MKEDDPLEDFVSREITLDGVSKRVYIAGSGPAVIVMSEMPGISPSPLPYRKVDLTALFRYNAA